MRRLLLPTVAAALLMSASTTPARAEGWKEYKDCLAFTYRWCKEAREDANFLEEMAVDAACTLMMIGCAGELI
jgi:hypothetical protein